MATEAVVAPNSSSTSSSAAPDLVTVTSLVSATDSTAVVNEVTEAAPPVGVHSSAADPMDGGKPSDTLLGFPSLSSANDSVTRSHGIFIPDSDFFTLDDCLRAISQKVPEHHVTDAACVARKVHVYFDDTTWVDRFVQDGLVINGVHCDVLPVAGLIARITISNVPPELGDTVLSHKLESYGSRISPIRRLRATSKLPEFAHVRSFCRQVFMQFSSDRDLRRLPTALSFSDSGVSYALFLKVDVYCSHCGTFSHTSDSCPQISELAGPPFAQDVSTRHSRSRLLSSNDSAVGMKRGNDSIYPGGTNCPSPPASMPKKMRSTNGSFLGCRDELDLKPLGALTPSTSDSLVLTAPELYTPPDPTILLEASQSMLFPFVPGPLDHKSLNVFLHKVKWCQNQLQIAYEFTSDIPGLLEQLHRLQREIPLSVHTHRKQTMITRVGYLRDALISQYGGGGKL